MNQPDYGLPNAKPTSEPRIKMVTPDPMPYPDPVPELLDSPCPRCKGLTCFTLEIDCDQPLLKGGKGIGTYIGCAGCGWASPMTIRSLEAK